MRMKTCLPVVLFVNVSLVSLFQFPLLPDGSRGGRGFVLFLRLFGISKLTTNSIEGMAKCFGNGVESSPSELVQCPYYWELPGMGVYAVLLAAYFGYVRIGGRFKGRKRCWRVLGTSDSTIASSRIPRGARAGMTRW